MSQRPSKRSLSKEAQRLRLRPGWNPHERLPKVREDQLRQSIEDQRVAATFDDADQCEACAKAREEQDDLEALCSEHLRKAMGL
jgi:hypothetical protein